MNWIRPGQPAVVLAPMEGVTDSPMRALFSERGGISYCVSEFLRISQEVPPEKVYFNHIPELAHGCKTPSGTPVQVQLLGGDADLMAASALRAFQLGAKAIDINFGCPAPLVNRRDGGATLLKYPERIEQIVASVRSALSSEIPVSAKLRLGWDSVDAIYENAKRAEAGGASWITIHARTKVQGYQPPVDWKTVGQISRQLSIPVVANGDIWTREDFVRCQEETGAIHFMLGRGALADPTLPHFVAEQLGLNVTATGSSDWGALVSRFATLCEPVGNYSDYAVCRTKQWMKMVHNRRSQPWFDSLKQAKTMSEINNLLQ